MKKRLSALALLTALCMMLGGCVSVPYKNEDLQDVSLPEPLQEPVNMFLGENLQTRSEDVTFYYVSGDGTSYSTVTRSLELQQEDDVCERAVNLLLGGSAIPSDRISGAVQAPYLTATEFSCGIITVDLSLETLDAESEQELLKLLTTVSNTLLSVEGVECVNVLVGGQAEGIASLPLGAQTEPFSGVTPAYAQLSAEQDYFLLAETGTIERTAILYFPTEDGKWLIPEARSITFDSTDYASALIRALRNGPSESLCAISAIPESVDLLVNNPTIRMTAAGDRVLQLDFSPTLLNYLAFSGLEEWELIGSVALTLCSFVPEIDGIQINIGDSPIESCAVGEAELFFEDGVIRRSDFSSCIGNAVRLYVPNENGTLNMIERAESQVRSRSPLSIMNVLLEVINSAETPVLFAEEITAKDVLGITVEDNIASINLSADFYRNAQALDAAGERGVIYAIVNTFCGFENISGVRFYIEGMTAETLSGSVYLKSILLPNPGLVESTQTAPEITDSP